MAVTGKPGQNVVGPPTEGGRRIASAVAASQGLVSGLSTTIEHPVSGDLPGRRDGAQAAAGNRWLGAAIRRRLARRLSWQADRVALTGFARGPYHRLSARS